MSDAPTSEADRNDEGPLAGIRVVSIATNLPGPAAAARLRSLGAFVTKVEPPSGDLLAHAVPEYYRELSAGQSIVTADLKAAQGREALDTLLSDADLFITSHRPAALERLGLDWAQLHDRYPRLSQVAIVGHDGTDAALPGHDLTYQATAGTLPDASMPAILAADLGGGERAAQVGCALLVEAARSGQGAYAEVALERVSIDLSAPLRHGMTGPRGVLGGAAPQYAIYPAADGYVAVAALEPHFWAGLVEALDLHGDDTAAQVAHLREVLAGQTAEHWDAWARQRLLPLAALRQPDGTTLSR